MSDDGARTGLHTRLDLHVDDQVGLGVDVGEDAPRIRADGELLRAVCREVARELDESRDELRLTRLDVSESVVEVLAEGRVVLEVDEEPVEEDVDFTLVERGVAG